MCSERSEETPALKCIASCNIQNAVLLTTFTYIASCDYEIKCSAMFVGTVHVISFSYVNKLCDAVGCINQSGCTLKLAKFNIFTVISDLVIFVHNDKSLHMSVG